MEATQEQKSILERIVVNGMRVMSDPKTAPQVDGFLDAGQSSGEGFSNAFTFVLSKVTRGLLAKGVEITPEILMSENGGASQIAQLIVALIESREEDITPNEIQKGIEIGLHNMGKMVSDDAQQQGAQPEQGQPPQGAAPQGAAGIVAPQGAVAPRQSPQGMLASRQAGGA